MGIINIQVLTEPELRFDDGVARQVQATHEATLVSDHYKGKHPWGSMRRDCPLCREK